VKENYKQGIPSLNSLKGVQNVLFPNRFSILNRAHFSPELQRPRFPRDTDVITVLPFSFNTGISPDKRTITDGFIYSLKEMFLSGTLESSGKGGDIPDL
jgi:hypothetical protein